MNLEVGRVESGATLMACALCKALPGLYDSGLCPNCGKPRSSSDVPEDDGEKAGRKFERYVLELLESLAFFGNTKVSRNRRFRGKTQPGLYEIDIAVEINVGDLLHFLIIVECKDWRRPVDRPVVQKIIQTREAIAAHKAAIVSPLGFTKEAIEVAEVHGVALWVLGSSGSRLGPVLYKVFTPPKLLRPIYVVAACLLWMIEAVRGIGSYPRMRLMASLGGRRTGNRPLLDARFARKEVYSGELEWNRYGPSTEADKIFDEIKACLRKASPLYWLRI